MKSKNFKKRRQGKPLLTEILSEVILAITSQTSLEAVLDEILRQSQRVVPHSAANIVLLQEGRLRIARWQGYETFGSELFLSSLEQTLSDFPLDAQVVQLRQPLIIADTHQNPHWVTAAETAWIMSFMAVPICLQDRILGLLRLDSPAIGAFSSQDVKKLEPLANAAAIALENAHLHDQARQEIAERIRVEEALKKSEANLKAILDNSLQAFLLISPDYKIQALNKNATERAKVIFGKEIEVGNSIYEILWPENLEGFSRNFNKALAGELVTLEVDIPAGNQSSWYEVNFIPVLAENGQVVSICLGLTNIDERKRAVDALAESEARLLAEMQSALVINRALVSEIDLNNLLEFIITQARHLTNADGVVVLLLNEKTQQLEVARPGASWSKVKAGLRIPVQGSLAELALTTGQVQISNEVLEDPRATSISALLQLAEVRSLLCAPLVAQRKQLGVLLIWTERGQIFTRHDSRLMGLFADQAALALQNAYLHDRNRQLAIEQERHRLARELHDSVTQSLYSMGLAAQTALRLLGQESGGQAREPIEYIHSLSQTALIEMRTQLYHLHPTILSNEDLFKALSRHCLLLTKQFALVVEFKANLKSALSLDQRNSLYYIAKEALWNIIKHASATHVDVLLAEEQGEVTLAIEDDGIGFEPEMFMGGVTMGLRTMMERTQIIGGTFELQSKPNQGTRLVVRIPGQLD